MRDVQYVLRSSDPPQRRKKQHDALSARSVGPLAAALLCPLRALSVRCLAPSVRSLPPSVVLFVVLRYLSVRSLSFHPLLPTPLTHPCQHNRALVVTNKQRCCCVAIGAERARRAARCQLSAARGNGPRNNECRAVLGCCVHNKCRGAAVCNTQRNRVVLFCANDPRGVACKGDSSVTP